MTTTRACWYATGTTSRIENGRDKLRQDERELRQLMDALRSMCSSSTRTARCFGQPDMLDYIGCTSRRCASYAEPLNKDVHPRSQRNRGERSLGLSNSVPFEMERRLLARIASFGGSLRYNPVMDEDGAVVRWFATATDIENADRPKTACGTRLSPCVKRSSDHRCRKRSSVHRLASPLLLEVERVAATDSTVLILGETGTARN